MLGNCTNLKTINASYNCLHHSINIAAFKSLSLLETLYLQHNDLKGPITEEVTFLRNLRFLNLSVNKIEGRLPEELGGKFN